MRRRCDGRNCVLRTGSALDIGEKELPTLELETSAQFLGHAGLAHAPLAGQQYVVAVAGLHFQHLQLCIGRRSPCHSPSGRSMPSLSPPLNNVAVIGSVVNYLDE